MIAARKYPQIGVRVDPEFRLEIKEIADRHFEGSEAALLRESARTYITLRRRLGAQYEPTIALLSGDAAARREEVLAS